TAAQTLDYYRNEYGKGSYYFEGAGGDSWCGRGAEYLGLLGKPITRDTFTRLVYGVAPDGTRLVRPSSGGGRASHRVGWDATINCPKSVSIQALVGGDPRILDAFSRACDVAFQELEHFAKARTGADRKSYHETHNLLAASFTH